MLLMLLTCQGDGLDKIYFVKLQCYENIIPNNTNMAKLMDSYCFTSVLPKDPEKFEKE